MPGYVTPQCQRKIVSPSRVAASSQLQGHLEENNRLGKRHLAAHRVYERLFPSRVSGILIMVCAI